MLIHVRNLWRKNLKRYHAQSAHFWLQRIIGRMPYLRLLHFFETGIYREEVTNTGILFFHVPKAAGTSVISALYGLTGYGHYRPPEAKEIDPDLYEKLIKVCLVRNPYSRVLSAYRFALSGGTSDVRIINKNRNQSIPRDFESFVTKWLPNQCLTDLDVIFHAQVDFIDRDDCKIFKLEEISNFESYISKVLGRNFKLSHKNVTSVSEDRYIDAYVSQVMIQIINTIYEDDFKCFGYSMRSLT